jgi:hypothetical protein
MVLRCRLILFGSALVVACILPAAASARAKTDIVFLTNGDRLTGEIKQLDRGILQLSTDAISTISIEWEDVDSLSSVYHFRVEDSRGGKYFGAIFRTRGGVVQVIRAGVSTEAPAASVVLIEPLEASFWQQLDGSISLGFSYSKADDLTQLTFDTWILRRTSIRQTRLDVDAILTNSSGAEKTVRYDAPVDHRRHLRGVLFAELGASLQRNDELGLDRRTAAMGLFGANLIQTNRTDLLAGAGVSVNHEWAADGGQASNVEAVLGVEHAIFGYDFPKINYSTQLAVYPSLNDWGRVRLELDLAFRKEIVSDLFVDLTFYDSYDNRPLGGGEKSDYGVVFSLGWSF